MRLRYPYDAAGRLAQIEDADGLRTRIERDAGGQALALVAAGSPSEAVPQAPQEQILSIEPPAAPVWLAEGAYKEAIESFERQLIEAGLAQGGGHIRTAARLLGIHRRTLRARIEKYGLSAVE